MQGIYINVGHKIYFLVEDILLGQEEDILPFGCYHCPMQASRSALGGCRWGIADGSPYPLFVGLVRFCFYELEEEDDRGSSSKAIAG